jgi:hypothetical protein
MCASCTIGGGEPNAGRKEAERLWLLHTTAEERKNPTAEVYENYYDKVNNADVAEDMAKLDELYKETEVEHAKKVRNRLEATPSKIPRLAKKKAGETKVPAPLKKAEQTRVQAPLKRAVKKAAEQKEASVVAPAKAAPTVTRQKLVPHLARAGFHNTNTTTLTRHKYGYATPIWTRAGSKCAPWA